ncbi:MAG: UDP-N-acetylmuramate dehydrogenase [Nitrospirota bacterium]
MKFTDLRGEVKLNEPLSSHTSFRIGGPVDALVYPADKQDVIVLLKEIKNRGLNYFFLGGGTNLLVRDGGFRGVAVSLARIASISLDREYRSVGGTFAVLHVQAGAPLQRLLNFSVENGLTGLEFATGIPGTVGGAVCMNAGTTDGELGDITDSVTLISPDGRLITKSREEMGFGYRTAKIPGGHLVLEATITLRRGAEEKIKNRVKELMDKRKQHQPWGMPSAGSVFKNPQDVAAGQLIESSGLKGKTVGGAQISEKHANFIVNLGSAKAADVLALMEMVKEKVLAVHNVRLEPEIKIIGEDA